MFGHQHCTASTPVCQLRSAQRSPLATARFLGGCGDRRPASSSAPGFRGAHCWPRRFFSASWLPAFLRLFYRRRVIWLF
ncbi:hypothetical protein EJB05_45049, partial [Eragrostis curvula]